MNLIYNFMRFFNFKQFSINEEKLGLSEASLLFYGPLKMRTSALFREFIISNDKKFGKTEIIDYRTLRPFIHRNQLDVYSQFPVVRFELDLDFKKLTTKEWEKKYGDKVENIATGGAASFFGNKNWSGYSKIVEPIKQVSEQAIIVNLGISIDVSPNFKLSEQNDTKEMNDDIASTIYHELNHCFEHYNRVIKYKSSITRPESRSFNTTLSYAGSNIWKFPKYIWQVWNKLNYYLYWSEFHEIRANVQEINYFITTYPEKDLSEFRIYQIADEMQKFDYRAFYDEFIKVLSTHKSYQGIEEQMADRFKEMWIRTYERECEEQGAKPIISISTLRKMSCLDFLKYWQKRINFAGERIKRKAHNIKASL